MLAVWSREPFPIRRWLLDAQPGLLGLSLFGQRGPHRDGLGYAFREPTGRWRLFRFGPGALTQGGIPGPTEAQALLLLAHARKASPEYQTLRGALHAHPFFHDGIFLCHNGRVGTRTDSAKGWARTPAESSFGLRSGGGPELPSASGNAWPSSSPRCRIIQP